jgi:hypothetical protein
VEELREVCLYPPLRATLRELIGEEMMPHLSLTSWVSTERNWHQDDRANSIGTAGFDTLPTITERFVGPAIEAEIHDRAVAPCRFLGRKGDVLIWHGRLMHRGTRPVHTGLERRALIAHYPGVSHRPDMPRRATDKDGGVYAVFDHKLA